MADVEKALAKIKDHQLKQQVQDILIGKVIKNVRCFSDKCNGRIVANIYNDGKIKATVSDGQMFLRASRPRLDGQVGFQCWCGNDSRLCKEEAANQGIINNAVTKEDVTSVLEELEKNPIDYPIVNGRQLVDNFVIEKI